jgi:hypothetical protein
MQSHDPETYQRIISQDRANVLQHGVGNAMAQAYNHTILPLAPLQDKRTQIAWGIADFQHRFGRETGRDVAARDGGRPGDIVSAGGFGIQFTILAPWQADVVNIDTSEPYRVDLARWEKLSLSFL